METAIGKDAQEFIRAYVKCALWSSVLDDGEPIDSEYSESDIAEETREKMKADCLEFLAKAETLIDGQYSQAGHDFWLTRNGHGAGFWDGDWPLYGEELTKLSKGFREVDLYVGDDGQVWA